MAAGTGRGGHFLAAAGMGRALHATSVGWNSVVGAHDFSTIDFRLKPHAGRWEGGTANVAGITGMGASMKLLLDVGIPALGERVLALTDYLCAKAIAAGWQVFSSREPGEKSGIVSLLKEGVSPFGIKRRCQERRYRRQRPRWPVARQPPRL